MRIKDLRIGDYVDVIVLNGVERTLCIVVDINIDECIPTMRNLTNNFEFNVGTKEKWNLVKDISEIGTQLKDSVSYIKLTNKYTCCLIIKWIHHNDVIETKYNGDYGLVIGSIDAFYCCREIPMPFVHIFTECCSRQLWI